MKKYYFDILKKINSNGYNSYIVGGFVRDKLLNIKTFDVDICTNATPKQLLSVFENNINIMEEYGAVKLKFEDNVIDITTFREDSEYYNNKPVKVNYTNDLRTDLMRRDFTINTLCLDESGNLIDLLNGKKDIKIKLIKCVGDTKTKFDEDATRLLRALRFMTTLKFNLSHDIIDYIAKNKNRFQSINYVKRKEELDKIFKCNNSITFLNFVKKNDLEKYIGIHFNNFVQTQTIIGCWAQLEFDKEYQFTKLEKKQIKSLKEILKKGNIDNYDLYKYGLYICTIAGEILNISNKKINKMYTNLPIKCIIDINISSNEICEVLNILPSKKISEIYNSLVVDILNGKIKNKKEEIISRLRSR